MTNNIDNKQEKSYEVGEFNEIGVLKAVESKLYNPKDKMDFLNDYLEDKATRNTYAIYFLKSVDLENEFKKDLHSFTKQELLNLFSDEFSGSKAVLKVFYSIVKKYQDWACRKGISRSTISPFNFMEFSRDVEPMHNVRALRGSTISEDTLWNIVNNSEICKNKNDGLCLLLPFYMVKGNQNNEIVDLKNEDVDYNNNTVFLTDVKYEMIEINGEMVETPIYSHRYVELPKKVMDYIKETIKETIYTKKATERGNKKSELYNNGYVIRPIVIKNKADGTIKHPKATKQLIATRVKRLLDSYSALTKNESYKKLSVLDIYNSGKIHIAKQIESEKGEVKPSDFREINKMFGDSELNIANIQTLYESIKQLEEEERLEQEKRKIEEARKNNNRTE